MKIPWSRTASVILFIWGTTNTVFSIHKYGWETGTYFWFCNVALLAMAVALWMKNRGLLIALLGPLCFSQTFWIADNLWRLLTGRNLYGIVEFLYHPGVLPFEFFLSHYHYFMMPTIALALLFYEKKRKDTSLYYVLILGIVLFALSYFIFPKEQNLNCIHEPCFPALVSWKGYIYSASFAILAIVLGLITAKGFDVIFGRIKLTSQLAKRLVIGAYVFLFLGSTLIIIIDMDYRAVLPKFSCGPPFEDSSVKVSCRYTQEYDRGIMIMVYQMKNKTEKPLECMTKLNLFGQYEILHRNVYLKPKQNMPISVLLPYPRGEVTAKLMASCAR